MLKLPERSGASAKPRGHGGLPLGSRSPASGTGGGGSEPTRRATRALTTAAASHSSSNAAGKAPGVRDDPEPAPRRRSERPMRTRYVS